MANVTIDMDLPEGITLTGYERVEGGHGFEVSWPLPEQYRCPRCQHEGKSRWEYRERVQVIRDLEVWGQPTFWVYQPAFQRCERCHHRHQAVPPFKRKDVSYTYRFEEHVLRMLIGSNETEVARRLGISAETVAHIVHLQLADSKDKEVEPERVITHVGIDELSLKKRHKLYVTLLTDLSDPQQPKILAVASGKDEAAARMCLGKLSAEQREQVRTYRVDMGSPYNNAGKELLRNAQAVIDRFHVAKKFGEAVDAERKKNHGGLQGEADEGPAEGVSRFDVGVSPRPEGLDAGGDSPFGGLVRAAAATAETAPSPSAFQGNLRYRREPQAGSPAIERLAPADFGRRSRPRGFLPDL